MARNEYSTCRRDVKHYGVLSKDILATIVCIHGIVGQRLHRGWRRRRIVDVGDDVQEMKVDVVLNGQG